MRRLQEVDGTGPSCTAFWINCGRATYLFAGGWTEFRASVRGILMIMERIKEAEAGFQSLTEAIDTTTAPGRMMMQMVGAFAEFERAILRERTKAGLDAARKQGRIGGRRPKLRPNQQDEIVTMVSTGTKTAADAARLFNVHQATMSRLLAKSGAGTISG